MWIWVALSVALTVLIGIFIGYGYRLPWTGFGEEESAEQVRKPKAREARPRKTLWDWLQLWGILAVPIAIAFFGTWFTVQQAQQSQKIENQRAKAEQKLAEQSAQYERLQAYLDQMSTLYLQKDLSDEKVRTLLRSRTLTVLDSLGPDGPHLEQGPRHKRIEHALRHKRTVMTFLSEASLIDKDNPVVDLKEANLNHADLNYMNLKNANLPFVFLKGSALDHVILENADLGGAHLENAYLGDANLSDANLNAAYLNGAYLNGANLSDAWGWTEEQLRAAQSLKGATMPDGQTLGDATTNGPTFEEWVKDKEGRRKNG